MNERLEQRVLGALCLVDRVTGGAVGRELRVRSAQLILRRNARGYHVIVGAEGLEEHTAAFAHPPASPPLGSRGYLVEISDPLARYLPRTVSVHLPRDPDPVGARAEDSLFRPLTVPIYPAATARLSPNWSSVRVSLSRGDDPLTATPVRGALLRIVAEADSATLASGISDQRGEALVIVPGVPLTKFAAEEDGGGDDEAPVVVNSLPVRLELSLGDTDPWPVDPDLLESNHAANRRLSMPLTLSTGKMEKVAINLT
ncbi:hypothetical protein ACHHRT_01210 [Desulfurivibrio sp. D14AmB]|uniref:hypothetical protein n=1 Tax=Desulfurivibrio sp. D14AmB TaxID=3374370 RepID=UPI00376EB6A9